MLCIWKATLRTDMVSTAGTNVYIVKHKTQKTLFTQYRSQNRKKNQMCLK